MSTKRSMNQSTIRASMYTTNISKSHSVLSKKTEDTNKLRVPICLTDENGVDCTPLPLLTDDKKIKDGDKETAIENVSQASFYAQSINSFNVINPAGLARSKSQQSSSGYTEEVSSNMSFENNEGVNTATLTDGIQMPQEKEKVLKEDDLDKEVEILLTETETMWIFDRPPRLFTRDSDEAAIIEKRNKAYEQFLSDRIGNDKYTDRLVNTFENPRMTRSLQTDEIEYCDQKESATVWKIYDCFKEIKENEQAEKTDKPDDNLLENVSPYATVADERSSQPINQPNVTISPAPGSVLHTAPSRTPTVVDKTQESISTHSESDLFGTRQSTATTTMVQDSQARNEEIMKSDNLAYSLFVMERTLNMNSYFEKLLYYRNLPYHQELMKELKEQASLNSATLDIMENETGQYESSESQTEPIRPSVLRETNLSSTINLTPFVLDKPHIMNLWYFNIPLTKGRNIASFAWNKQNADIIAVGYGEFNYSKQKKGLVCCWSLKNIYYPERIIEVDNGVTALSWSKAHSNLLAVGMFDGTISVFDLRKKSDQNIIDTRHASGRHIGPVRQLEWVIRASGRSEEHSEVLVSISSDGRVTQWSVRKGFESSDLMKLKRIATKIPIASKQKKTDALISQYAAGSCIDFNPNDPNIYLVGVEDGNIHKCSCSYNEQYLDNFFGHTAPVYAIKWSPFNSEVFISCSADWTIKLWRIDRNTPALNIQSSVKGVNSIAWSPKSSCIFACVNESAIEVWNLAASTLDPIIMESLCPESTVLTSITFTSTGECLLVGDSEGTIHTLRLGNMPDVAKNQTEALNKIIDSCIASQL